MVSRAEEGILKNFYQTQMQKEIVLQRLKENGYRITKQRQILLDVILEAECTSCKEIFYKANKLDSGIGYATVYRMVNLLEDIGAINRNNRYKISCCMGCSKEDVCLIEFEDHAVCRLSAREWYQVISEGLKSCGYSGDKSILSVVVEPCSGEANC